MRDEDTHMGPFSCFLANLKILLLYQGPRPVFFRTAQEQSRIVATEREGTWLETQEALESTDCNCYTGRTHRGRHDREWANGGDMWPEPLHMEQYVMTDDCLW